MIKHTLMKLTDMVEFILQLKSINISQWDVDAERLTYQAQSPRQIK